MSALLVYAREDLLDAFRERQAYVFVGVFVLLAGVTAYNVGRTTGPNGEAIAPALVPRLFPLLNLLVPLVAVGFFAAAIVGKRERGSLKVILGLPVRRRDVLLGTFLARSALLVLSVGVAILLAATIGILTPASVEGGHVLGAIGVLSLVGIVFVAFAVAISAMVATTTRAMLTGLALWVFFAFQFWASLPRAVLYVRHGFAYPAQMPAWVDAIVALNPLVAYANLLEASVPAFDPAMLFDAGAPPGPLGHPLVSLAILVAWIGLSLVVALSRFRRTEL